MVRGDVTGKDLEKEFQVWADALGSGWRFNARPINDVEFLMRFPSARSIDDFHFGKVFMKTIPDAIIQLSKWNGDLEPVEWLEEAWFRIVGIPMKFREKSTVFYVASLVGKPLALDKNSLRNLAYVRVKIACLDVSLVPNTRRGRCKGDL